MESDLNSFINTSRHQRAQSMTANSPRVMSYPSTNFDTQSELYFDRTRPPRAYSPDDLQKLRYKIDLGKQATDSHLID